MRALEAAHHHLETIGSPLDMGTVEPLMRLTDVSLRQGMAVQVRRFPWFRIGSRVLEPLATFVGAA